MRKTLGLAVVAAGLCLAAPGLGRAGMISFDEGFVAGVPVTPYSQLPYAAPLTEAYAAMGVHFNGPSSGSGGVLVSDFSEFLNFGVLPHSGNNVLAFNGNAPLGFPFPPPPFGPPPGAGTASGPETIAFDNAQAQVSIWAAGGLLPHTFEIQAFDSHGNLLTSEQLTTQDWSQLSVSASGIASVVLTEIGHPYDSYVYDDLSFTPDAGSVGVNGGAGGKAPEPGGVVLLGMGGLCLAGWRRRPKYGERPA